MATSTSYRTQASSATLQDFYQRSLIEQGWEADTSSIESTRYTYANGKRNPTFELLIKMTTRTDGTTIVRLFQTKTGPYDPPEQPDFYPYDAPE